MLALTDFIAPVVPIGLLAGRIGNFINAELWGKVTNVPWAMIFPTDPESLPRHPSQLYEAIMEGLILFIISFILFRKTKKSGLVFWSWIGLYGIFRFLIEFVREPDAQLGYVIGFMTMGQILCLIMIIMSFVALLLLSRNDEINEKVKIKKQNSQEEK